MSDKPGTFQKGDKRINRKGRPKSFDALRELAQQIGHEAVSIGDKQITVTEAILRQWAQSKNPQLQKAFIEIAYGKVPDDVNLKAEGEIKHRVTLNDESIIRKLLPELAASGTTEPAESVE